MGSGIRQGLILDDEWGARNEHRLTRIIAGEAVSDLGVADGTRTRDSQDHNLVLYQLNYSHHRRTERRR